MSIERVFLGWDRPALAGAVEHLARRFASAGLIDLAEVIVAVPGSRAGRRLLELLVERAEAAGEVLVPPEIVTVGRLPELLYTAKRPFAGDVVQQLAWVEALRRTEPARRARLLPNPPEPDDLPGWLALGEMLGRLHRELAAESLDFQAVVDCGQRIVGFAEAPRWETLREIQQAYLAALDRLGLWDLQTARLFAIRHGECATSRRIVLLGTVDLNRAQRMMLDQVEDRVTALVFAPPELADRFDEHGCLIPRNWLDARIPIETEAIEVVDSPADQAAAVLRALARLEGRYTAEEITLGVPDARVVPHLLQQLRQCGVPARYGVGMPVCRSEPYRLLAAVAEYLDGRRFAAFAALVRHPAVQDWIESSSPPIRGDWLTELDQYHEAHLPLAIGRPWLGPPSEHALVRQVFERVEGLLGDLSGPARPLSVWGPAVIDLLVAVFGGRPLDPAVPGDRTTLSACEKLRDALAEHERIPGDLAPDVSAPAAVRLALRAVSSETIAPPPDPRAVELLGWLELPLDDAPVLVVTGMNEGIVPGSCNEDLFLPNQLRRELGILDNDQRLARDVYALSVLAVSRRRLRLIAGRRSAEGDPLVPSRLLFAADPLTAAQRVVRFCRGEEPGATGCLSASTEAGSPSGLPSGAENAAGQASRGTPQAGPLGQLRPGRARSTFQPPRPEPATSPVVSMRVTEFRDFLACPYRYYLRHRLGLGGLCDAAEELDGGLFGSLVHEVLGEFGGSEAAGSSDPERITAFLDTALDARVRRLFGPRPLPALLVQVEQLRLRLAGLAHWQADWAAAGWQIERVETGPEPEQAALVVDGQPMYLRGRIDRVDLHATTGRRVVIDYKTSDSPETPEKAHRRGGRWVDLQLPLYRHLCWGMGLRGPIELAYLLLPKDVSKAGLSLATWSEDDLGEADMVAAEVVRRVRAGDFWPPAAPPPPFCEDFAGICHDGQFSGLVAGELEEEDESGEGDAS